MGYKTSFSATQKKFQTSLRRRNNKVLITGVQGCLRCPSLEQTTSRYLALMVISDDAKGGILVLTRYFLDFFRARGFKRVIDDFAKKANIDEKQHTNIYLIGPFFVRKSSKHSKNTLCSLGESYTSTTRTHFPPQDSGHSKLRTSLDSGMITHLHVILVNIVVNIVFGYIFLSSDVHINDMFKKLETNEQPHANQSRSTSSNSKSIASRVKKRQRCVFSFSIASRVKKRCRCTDAVMKI
ncbi:unnamed protein product [Lactuca saligna]|uniref:Uncharacterized protein n=1 Tax=Lactuca saligna TaxID=75948 RepID=A0AA35Z1S4_LACSI|nr:unnamed protein product [Lactuca saligna]